MSLSQQVKAHVIQSKSCACHFLQLAAARSSPVCLRQPSRCQKWKPAGIKQLWSQCLALIRFHGETCLWKHRRRLKCVQYQPCHKRAHSHASLPWRFQNFQKRRQPRNEANEFLCQQHVRRRRLAANTAHHHPSPLSPPHTHASELEIRDGYITMCFNAFAEATEAPLPRPPEYPE